VTDSYISDTVLISHEHRIIVFFHRVPVYFFANCKLQIEVKCSSRIQSTVVLKIWKSIVNSSQVVVARSRDLGKKNEQSYLLSRPRNNFFPACENGSPHPHT
jgi:hypothetical protein